jgi:hypothetical protein
MPVRHNRPGLELRGHGMHSGFIIVSGVLRPQTSHDGIQKPSTSDYAASQLCMHSMIPAVLAHRCGGNHGRCRHCSKLWPRTEGNAVFAQFL